LLYVNLQQLVIALIFFVKKGSVKPRFGGGVVAVLLKMLPDVQVKANAWQIVQIYRPRTAHQCNGTPKTVDAETHLPVVLGLVLSPPRRLLSLR
jgi:hypothetical protein